MSYVYLLCDNVRTYHNVEYSTMRVNLPDRKGAAYAWFTDDGYWEIVSELLIFSYEDFAV